MRIPAVIILAVAALSALASAQILTCASGGVVPPVVRPSGKTELVGALVLNCTGGTPTPAGSPVPLYNIKVRAQSLVGTYDSSGILTNATLAPVNITSRQLTSDGSSEAIALLDEPHNFYPNSTVPLLACGDPAAPATAGVCTILGTGTG